MSQSFPLSPLSSSSGHERKDTLCTTVQLAPVTAAGRESFMSMSEAIRRIDVAGGPGGSLEDYALLGLIILKRLHSIFQHEVLLVHLGIPGEGDSSDRFLGAHRTGSGASKEGEDPYGFGVADIELEAVAEYQRLKEEHARDNQPMPAMVANDADIISAWNAASPSSLLEPRVSFYQSVAGSFASLSSSISDSRSSPSSGDPREAKDHIFVSKSKDDVLKGFVGYTEVHTCTWGKDMAVGEFPGVLLGQRFRASEEEPLAPGHGFRPHLLHALAIMQAFRSRFPTYSLTTANCYSFAGTTAGLLMMLFNDTGTYERLVQDRAGKIWNGAFVPLYHSKTWSAMPQALKDIVSFRGFTSTWSYFPCPVVLIHF